MIEIMIDDKNKSPSSACSSFEVLCSARAIKTLAAACISSGSEHRKIYSNTVPTKEMEKLEIEMLEWKKIAKRLQSVLRLHAYTGYKDVSEVLNDFEELNKTTETP